MYVKKAAQSVLNVISVCSGALFGVALVAYILESSRYARDLYGGLWRVCLGILILSLSFKSSIDQNKLIRGWPFYILWGVLNIVAGVLTIIHR